MGHWYSGSTSSSWLPRPEEATDTLLRRSSSRIALSVADTALATSDVASEDARTRFSAHKDHASVVHPCRLHS